MRLPPPKPLSPRQAALPKGMMYGPNDALIPIPPKKGGGRPVKNPGKPTSIRPGTMGDGVGGRPKGTGKPAAGMAGAKLGKMMGMAKGGSASKGKK